MKKVNKKTEKYMKEQGFNETFIDKLGKQEKYHRKREKIEKNKNKNKNRSTTDYENRKQSFVENRQAKM